MSTHDWDQYNAFVDPAVTAEVIASGWLGFPGASEEEIADARRNDR